MKKLYKYVTPLLCISALVLGILSISMIGLICQNVFSAVDSSTDLQLRDNYVEEENINLYHEVINLIDDELKTNNTSVIEQLQVQIDEYQNMLVNNTYKDKEKLQALINLNKAMLKSYNRYENSKLTRKADNPTYTPLVTAAITYFKAKSYKLSAELLSFALENEQLDTYYTIENSDIIEKASKFNKIAFDTKLKGSDSFEKTGATVDDDLYYAIHAFRFEKQLPNSRTVKIEDRYDFAYNENAQSTLEKIVNSMYYAQEVGVLVPFQISQTISLNSEIDLKEENSYQETFDIAIGESRRFEVKVYDQANLRVQIIDSNYSAMITACCIAIGSSQPSKKPTPTVYTFEISSENSQNDNKVTLIFSNVK